MQKQSRTRMFTSTDIHFPHVNAARPFRLGTHAYRYQFPPGMNSQRQLEMLGRFRVFKKIFFSENE